MNTNTNTNTILDNNNYLNIEGDVIPFISGMGALDNAIHYDFSNEVLTINSEQVSCSREVFCSKGLQLIISDLGKLTTNQQDKTKAYFAEGFTGEKQKRVYLSGTNTAPIAAPTAKKPVESSADWLSNRVKRFIAGADAITALSEFYEAINARTSKTTKEELIAMATNLIDVMVTEKDKEELETLKAEETILTRLEGDIKLIDNECKVSVLPDRVSIRDSSSEALKHVMVLVNESYTSFNIGNMQRPNPLESVNGFDVIKK